MVIAAFMGMKPSGGFGIMVKDISLVGEVLKVDLEILSPAPRQFMTMALTSPWVMVEVSSANFNEVEFLEFYADGKPLDWPKR
ncbi:MAG: protease complex subunit PrcB family protein [Deinococcales bacterium]